MATLPTGITVYNFPSISQGDRGDLTFVEGDTHIPFKIERIFWVYDISSEPHIERGGHAHKKCEQVMIAVHGDFFVEMSKLTYHLYNPSQGVYIPPGIAVKIYGFSEDCVMLVLCSHHFSEEDYVRETNQVYEPVAR